MFGNWCYNTFVFSMKKSHSEWSFTVRLLVNMDAVEHATVVLLGQ